MIGIIDSGLGGLSIARAIWQKLPGQATIYLADHEFFPYGNKTAEVINQRLIKIVDWLIAKNCRLVVIACNTITATAIDQLRRGYAIPFIGTEPTVKLGGIVLATPTTAASLRYRQLAKNFPAITLACPGLAEAIEHGEAIEPFLPKLPAKAKIVALGCTHYILVKDKIQKIYGRQVKIVDPSEAIANQTVKMLAVREKGRRRFYTTGPARKLRGIMFSRCSL